MPVPAPPKHIAHTKIQIYELYKLDFFAKVAKQHSKTIKNRTILNYMDERPYNLKWMWKWEGVRF